MKKARIGTDATQDLAAFSDFLLLFSVLRYLEKNDYCIKM
jgi:hypothetical protein